MAKRDIKRGRSSSSGYAKVMICLFTIGAGNVHRRGVEHRAGFQHYSNAEPAGSETRALER
jgi:hypothetical protein